MKRITALVLIAFLAISFKTEKGKDDIVAYRIFDRSGKEVKFNDAAAKLLENQVVFFGELHNNPLAHWFQLKLTMLAFEKMKENVVLGAEMFESDNQLLMNEYLSGTISEKSFEEESRLWPNYKTDYKPLVSFAKEKGLKFVCTNIPRRYANMVYKGGIEALMKLSDEAKSYIAPLPFEYDGEVGCYKKMKEMSGGHGGDNLPKAQASKDATMAHFISKYASKDKLFIHYNGSYHSDNNEGIQWYLNKYAPTLKRASITTVLQKDPSSLEKEYHNLADYIIVVAEDMTSTH
jgi:uncharacterized iron-regulated protein